MSESDRSYVQNEIDQLVTELDRVSETTKFNETYLLKGNAEGTTSQMTVNAHDAGLDGKLTANGDGTSSFALKKDLADGDKVMIAGKQYTIGASAADFKKTEYAEADNSTLKNSIMKVGDSIYDADTDKTYTLVGKVANDSAGIYGSGTKFTITAANGAEVNYAIGTEDHASDPQLVSAANAKAIVADALKAGSTVTMTADKDGKAVNYQIVEKLDDGVVSGNKEISIIKSTDGSSQSLAVSTFAGSGFANVSTGALTEGDKVTLAGEETVVTSTPPASRETIEGIVDVLNKGDTVKVQSYKEGGAYDTTGVTFTIADETNEAAGEYTTADLKKVLGDFDEITFNVADTNAKAISLIKTTTGNSTYAGGAASAAVTLTPNQTATTAGDVLSKSQAYDLMAEEIQKASSIGTDEAAKVAHDGKGNFTITQGSVEVKDKLNFNLHVGADADMTNKINVNIDAMSAAGLGVKGLNVTDTTGMAATYAIDAIEDAINKVSTQRSALGAVQNRLEHTINNLDNVVENTTSAESAIRDTDMASEMVKYSNNNILAQAGQAMLAQANQSNQGVLSLLG
jgi:flagellin-like hook-associated protein FlgL